MPIDPELLAAHLTEFEYGSGQSSADVSEWSNEELLYRIRFLTARSGGGDDFDGLLAALQDEATTRGILS